MNFCSHHFFQNANQTFEGFLPYPLINFQGRNSSNFWLAYWEKRWPYKFILNLTDLYEKVNFHHWNFWVSDQISPMNLRYHMKHWCTLQILFSVTHFFKKFQNLSFFRVCKQGVKIFLHSWEQWWPLKILLKKNLF